MTEHAADVASLWFAAGRPDRMVWRGQRWRITDAPTELDDLLTMITHPPSIVGWRFQATNAYGDTNVFDVMRAVPGPRRADADNNTGEPDTTDAAWFVTRVYD